MQQVRDLHQGRSRGDGRGEQEAEARGLLAPVAQEEGGADRGAGAGDAGDDGERLREADEDGVPQPDLLGSRPRGRRAPVGDQQHGAHQRHRRGHQGGRSERGLRPLVQEEARDRPRHRCQREQPQQPRLRLGEGLAAEETAHRRGHEPHPVSGEGEEHRGQRPQVESDVESEAVVRPAQEPRNDDEMARAADGQELAEPLHDPEHDGLRGRHRSASLAAPDCGPRFKV